VVFNVRILEPKVVLIGPIALKCYTGSPDREVIEERKIAVREDDIFGSISREVLRVKKEVAKRARSNSLVVIEVSGKGFAYKHGGKLEDTGEERLLFPAPSKLVRLGVYRDGRLAWFRPKKGEELYVYEGLIDAPPDVDFVIIETESGSRVIPLREAERGGPPA